MKSQPIVVSAAEFKARCFALLERVRETGEPMVITKRGRAVARVVPIEVPKRRTLRKSVRILGDIVAPIETNWEAAN